jgi:hypothetical protein
MSGSATNPAIWKLCALTCLGIVLLSLLPQFHLWLVQGRNWNGAYVGPYGDELLYSAYVNALIEGRTRKNDPFGGIDNTASAPLPESFFSIQFVPAYVIAVPARTFGISVSTAFIVLISLAALFASLSVFWLLHAVTSDCRIATAGTLFVLCFGCIVGRYSLFGTFLDVGFPALPFLRRYQPAVAFPLFFVFQGLVWRMLTKRSKRFKTSAIVAGISLATLVFSYLYLWTAAAAWLACIGLLWLYFRPSERRRVLALLIMIGGIITPALVLYAYLLSYRAPISDEPLIFISTHQPDLLRPHEILGAAILIALVIGILRGKIARTEPRVIYVVSLALLPFIVFNQQVLSGRTMQVFHFETFVVNYSTLIALVVLIDLLWKAIPPRLLVWTACLSLVWGIVVVGLPARLLFVPWAISNDRRVPILRRLNELSKEDGTLTDLRAKGKTQTLVFSSSVALINLLPTWTSQGTLLDVTGAYCRSLTRDEAKEFFFMHLYYSDVDSDALRKALRNTPDEAADELANVRTVVFGHDRVFPYLSSQFSPIQDDEIEREVQAYMVYTSSFSREEVLKRPIAYAVFPADRYVFEKLDRWYERDAGERMGDYTLYRLKLRD